MEREREPGREYEKLLLGLEVGGELERRGVGLVSEFGLCLLLWGGRGR